MVGVTGVNIMMLKGKQRGGKMGEAWLQRRYKLRLDECTLSSVMPTASAD